MLSGQKASNPSRGRLLHALNRYREEVEQLETVNVQYQKALVRSHSRFRRLVESNIVGIMIGNLEGHIVDANDYFLNLVGYRRADLPLHLDRLTPERWRELTQSKRLETSTTGIGTPFEKEYLHKDGYGVPVMVGVARADHKIDECIVCVVDLSQKKHAEQLLLDYQQRLRTMHSEVFLAQEREKHRIATGLHDDVGQTLATIKLKLDQLARACRDSELLEPVTETIDLIEHAIASTRTLTFDLSSTELHELGLVAALDSLADTVAEQYQLALAFHADDPIREPCEPVGIVLYRAVRELLLNISKHAMADSASITVGDSGETLQIIVRDDGIGFDASVDAHVFGPRGGFGLLNVRERLSHIGGTVEVTSRPGEGTRITLAVPSGTEILRE